MDVREEERKEKGKMQKTPGVFVEGGSSQSSVLNE
jgi:hypothetical protein